jgi:hypothetical protein
LFATTSSLARRSRAALASPVRVARPGLAFPIGPDLLLDLLPQGIGLFEHPHDELPDPRLKLCGPVVVVRAGRLPVALDLLGAEVVVVRLLALSRGNRVAYHVASATFRATKGLQRRVSLRPPRCSCLHCEGFIKEHGRNALRRHIIYIAEDGFRIIDDRGKPFTVFIRLGRRPSPSKGLPRSPARAASSHKLGP